MSVTAQDIISRAHLAADTPEDSTTRPDAPASHPEMLDICNEGLSELHDLIVASWEEYFTVTDTSKTTTASTATTALPADFYKLRSIWLQSAGCRYQLHRYDDADMDGASTTDTTDRPGYAIEAGKLRWYPLPDGAYTLEIKYIRRFAPLTSTTDEIRPEIPDGWEMYVVGHCAAYLLNKQEMDPRPAMELMARASNRIRAMASRRDATGPEMIRRASFRRMGSGRLRRHSLPYPRKP